MNKPFLSMLSISRKAGALKTGDFQCSNSIKSKEAFLVIVATDSGKNTKKKFTNSCNFYEVKKINFQQKAELSWAIGRANVSVIAVTDENLAKKLLTIAETDDEFKSLNEEMVEIKEINNDIDESNSIDVN